MLLYDDESLVARRILSEIEYAAKKQPRIYHAVQKGLMDHIDGANTVGHGDGVPAGTGSGWGGGYMDAEQGNRGQLCFCA
jgi:hypothetical protein